MSHIQNIVDSQTVLAYKAKHGHIHVTGCTFVQDHKMLGNLYDTLQEINDTLLERLKACEMDPVVSLKDALKNSSIKESSETDRDALFADIASDLETISDMYSDAYKNKEYNPVTVNILQEACATIDKHRWFFMASTASKPKARGKLQKLLAGDDDED